MKSSAAPAFALILLAFSLTGCVSTGLFRTSHLTNVELSEDNFCVVATNVAGQATAGYLIGASISRGFEMRTAALIQVSGPDLIYQAALENLIENFEEEHGPFEGRSLALVNVRYDSEALNLGVYTQPMVSVRADVVEFISGEEECGVE